MVFETLKDISSFVIIFIVSVLMFGTTFLALDGLSAQPNSNAEELSSSSLRMLQESGEEVQHLWDPAVKYSFIDSAFAQYRIGLGDFNMDGWSDHPAQGFIYFYFILATLFTQMMFLNMLIAIMGSTYERVTEQRERAALMEQSHIIGDWMWFINLTKDLNGKRYLYVVR